MTEAFRPTDSNINREFVDFINRIDDLLIEKYQTKRPQAEARTDALIWLSSIIASNTATVFNPYADPDEREVLAPQLEEALSVLDDLATGNWDSARNFIKKEAQESMMRASYRERFGQSDLGMEDEKEAQAFANLSTSI